MMAMRTRYPKFDELDSLFAYQCAIMVLSQYDPSNGAIHTLAHDWTSYFQQRHAGDSTMNPPARTQAVLSIND